MNEMVLRNARMVLAQGVHQGDLALRDGLILDIGERGRSRSGVDFEGDWLIPGLVELHTDHLEGHYAPRPKVRWNPAIAVQAHDAQIASSGITTVFDALRVGMDEDANLGVSDMRALADAIAEGRQRKRLRADHFIHLRCEVSAPDVVDGFAQFERDERVRIVSLMDHTPGQRQFVSMEAYRVYYQGKTGMSDAQFAAFVDRRRSQAEIWSDKHRKAIAAACRDRDIVMASHDDATVDHVSEAIDHGIGLAEFPTTLEAAKAAHAAGMTVLMGAPNVVRGGSHSGNVSARTLIAEGTLDALSSDYIPFSLIQAGFMIAEGDGGIDLSRAIAMVTANPAAAAGLTDRGVIAPGKRADLVRVHLDEGVPVVRGVWREAVRVA